LNTLEDFRRELVAALETEAKNMAQKAGFMKPKEIADVAFQSGAASGLAWSSQFVAQFGKDKEGDQ
jgi:hypothetical protein